VTSLKSRYDTADPPRRATFAKRTAGILPQIIAGVMVIRAGGGRRFQSLADVAVRPGVQQAGRVQASPPTTADCEKAYKVACYQPAQIRQAYDRAGDHDRRRACVRGRPLKVLLSRTGLGASLGNGVII